MKHNKFLSDVRNGGLWGTAMLDLSGNGNRVYAEYFSKYTNPYDRG